MTQILDRVHIYLIHNTYPLDGELEISKDRVAYKLILCLPWQLEKRRTQDMDVGEVRTTLMSPGTDKFQIREFYVPNTKNQNIKIPLLGYSIIH